MNSLLNKRYRTATETWLIALSSGAGAMTLFSLCLLVVQLVFAGEPYRHIHGVYLIGGLVGFVAYVAASGLLINMYERGLNRDR